MIVRIVAAVALALAGAPALAQQVQLDKDNPEHVFRSLAAYSAAAERCLVGDDLDAEVALMLAGSMSAGAPDPAQVNTVRDQVIAAAKNTQCVNPELTPMLALAIIQVLPSADAIGLAFLDQGFCPASALAADMRLYALVRDKDLSPARRANAAAARSEMATHLKEKCLGKWSDLGIAYNLAGAGAMILRETYAKYPCFDDAGTSGRYMFECVYGEDKLGVFSDNDSKRFARYQQRAAIAKAAALELDAKKRCKQFSPAQRAAGEAQMNIDAGYSLLFSQHTGVVRAADSEKRYASPAEAIAAGRTAAASLDCAAFRQTVPYAWDSSKPLIEQGESQTAAAGALRINQTLDRMAMLVASLPQCQALPNFAATKKAALEHVATMTREARLGAASAVRRPAEIIEEANCDPAKLQAEFPRSPLAKLDALNGKWK